MRFRTVKQALRILDKTSAIDMYATEANGCGVSLTVRWSDGSERTFNTMREVKQYFHRSVARYSPVQYRN